MKLEGKNVLVTGGTGMIGNEVVDQLVNKGANVKVVSIEEKARLSHDVEYEKLDYVMKNFVHQQIKLEKIKNHYQGEVNHPFIDKQQFFYNLGPSGMIEQS